MRCPAFFLKRLNGTAFFLAVTSLRYCFAVVSIIPFIVLQISLACLWDTRISLPLAFAVFSGLSSSVMEYPQFGMCISPTAQLNSVKAIYMAFRIKTRSTIKWTSLVPFFEGAYSAVRCTKLCWAV